VPVTVRKPAVRELLIRAFAWLPLAAAALLIGAYGGVQARVYLPVYSLLFAAMMFAAAFWSTGILPDQSLKRAAWALLVVAIPLAQLVFHTTVDRAATQTAFLHILAAACGFWLVGLAADRHGFRRSVNLAAAIAAGVLGTWGILQFFLTPHQIFGVHTILSTLPMGPFVDRDDFAACVELLLPAVVVLAFERRTLPGRFPDAVPISTTAWGAVAGLAVGGVILSGSRAGFLVVVLQLGLLLSTNWSAPVHRRRMVGIVVGLVMVFGVMVGVKPLVERYKGSWISASGRLDLVRSSVLMGTRHPFMGFGAGTWAEVYPRFQFFDDGTVYDYAHSDLAQAWAETGSVGLIMCAALLVYIFRMLRVAPRIKSRENQPFCVGVAGIGLHALIDFPLHIPALLLLSACWLRLAMDKG